MDEGLRALLRANSVDGPGGCRLCTGRREDGRALVRLGSADRRADVLACEEYHGPIPDGHRVLHRCGRTTCIEPTHLFTADCDLPELIRRHAAKHPDRRPGRIATDLGLATKFVRRALRAP